MFWGPDFLKLYDDAYIDDDRDGLDMVATMLINGGAEVRTCP
jgi:hypothetical protein